MRNINVPRVEPLTMEHISPPDIYELIIDDDKFLSIKWMISNCLVTKRLIANWTSIVRAAARYGNLNCLIYLHEQGCLWNSWTCVAAARGGHLVCLIYLHENGCEWTVSTIRAAAANSHPPASCRLIT